jgi:hypothetical protein
VHQRGHDAEVLLHALGHLFNAPAGLSSQRSSISLRRRRPSCPVARDKARYSARYISKRAIRRDVA